MSDYNYPQLTENMWCDHCEHEWETHDYFNCNACPNCDAQPVRIFRTSSTAYAYAYMNKQKKKQATSAAT